MPLKRAMPDLSPDQSGYKADVPDDEPVVQRSHAAALLYTGETLDQLWESNTRRRRFQFERNRIENER